MKVRNQEAINESIVQKITILPSEKTCSQINDFKMQVLDVAQLKA